jgi:hypothetical protein
MKRARYCQMPTSVSVTGRSSSITNAFINAIVPAIEPTEEEEIEALRILDISPDDIRCIYWRRPCKIDFAGLVGGEMWDRHRENWRTVLLLLKTSQQLAAEIRQIVAQKKSEWSRALED